MRIVLLGAPGSGKGTQAKLIARAYEAPHIPMNELLRAAVVADTPFGRQAKVAMEAGQPITDDVMLGIVQERLSQQDAREKFILDGFPRTLSQAEALDAMLEQRGQPLQAVVLIEVDFETLLQRFTGRRTCVSCGKTYNIYTAPSRLDDRCDECGGNLRHRADEKEETISNRLRVYDTQTAPLIEYYRRKGLLRVVPGSGEIDDISKEIRKTLDSLVAEEKAVAEKPAVAPAKKEKPKAAPLTRAAKAALTAAEQEIKTITKAARSVEKKAVRTAKKIVRAAEKEAKVATKAVRTLKKKALQTTRKLLEKAEKAVETKKKAKPAAKPSVTPKVPSAKKVAAKAVAKVAKKVAVKKAAVKAAPKKPLKAVVAKKGTVKKAAARKKAAPAKSAQKAAGKRR